MRVSLSYVMIIVGILVACSPLQTPIAPLPTQIQPPTQTATVIAQRPSATLPPLITSVETQPIATALPSVTPSQTPTLFNTRTSTTTATRISVSATLPTTATPTLQPIMPTPISMPNASESPFPTLTTAHYQTITIDQARTLLTQAPDIIVPPEHVLAIYQRGQARDLDPYFLLSVGDCNSESHWYLETLLDNQSEMAQDDFFTESSRQQMISNYRAAFDFKGQSANSGLNALSVLDPFWANPNVCEQGMSPLLCDYQTAQAFAAVIMFGANDVNVLNTEQYELALRDIIETTLDYDMIPILSTFSMRPKITNYEQGVRFNGVVVQLAQEYQIPLINFWQATRDLPDNGVLDDNAHLTSRGFYIRNQLTLMMLEEIQALIQSAEG